MKIFNAGKIRQRSVGFELRSNPTSVANATHFGKPRNHSAGFSCAKSNGHLHMQMHQRGQAVSFDFAIAIFVFVLAFVSLAALWQASLDDFINAREFQDMQTTAFLLSETLVETRGNPENWEHFSFQDVNVFGLAEKDRVLDREKILRLNSYLSADYDSTREKLRLPLYGIYIRIDSLDQGTADINMGVSPPEGHFVANIRRIVDYNGSEAKFDVMLYLEQ